MSTTLENSVAQFLTTLGWEIIHRPNHRPDLANLGATNEKFPELLVERAQRGAASHDPFVFVLTAKSPYDNRVQRTLVDGRLPRYQRKVHGWFQASTLAIADAKRAEEEKRAEQLREERRTEDAVRAAVGEDADVRDIRHMVDISFRDDGGVKVLGNVECRYYIPCPFTLPKDLPVEEKLRRVDRLVKFLRAEGMLGQR